MREVAGSSVATISISFAPIVAQRFGISIAVATFLSLAFAFTFAAFARRTTLLPVPFRGIFMDLPLPPFTGWISSPMASNSASIAPNLASARLVVSIHDGEARVSFLPTPFVHFISPPVSKLIGSDELEPELGIIRQVINSIICPCVIFTIRDRNQIPCFTLLSQPS